MMGMSKGDRKVLLVLLILVLVLMGYLGITGAKSNGISQSYPDSTKDTVYIEVPSRDTTMVPPAEKVDTLPIRTARYPGPPERAPYQKKLTEGSTIDLNSADTLLLMRIPGIGESFARRICKYRELLGGYYVVEQLQEVYGMDRQRYDQIAPFVRIETPVTPLVISRDSIPRHPYLQWHHVNAMKSIMRSGKEITWEILMKSGKFTHDDSLRLAPYLKFPLSSETEENGV